MRNIILALMAGAIILLSGCSDGTTTPGSHDLTGLEGTWDYTITAHGTVNGPGGSSVDGQTETGYWVINTNSVIDQNGDPWGWSYDGSILTLDYEDSLVMPADPTCGEILVTSSVELTIPVTSGATAAVVSGNSDIDFDAELCDDVTGSLPTDGNMTKR
jgi:hypothetical protein